MLRRLHRPVATLTILVLLQLTLLRGAMACAVDGTMTAGARPVATSAHAGHAGHDAPRRAGAARPMHAGHAHGAESTPERATHPPQECVVMTVCSLPALPTGGEPLPVVESDAGVLVAGDATTIAHARPAPEPPPPRA